MVHSERQLKIPETGANRGEIAPLYAITDTTTTAEPAEWSENALKSSFRGHSRPFEALKHSVIVQRRRGGWNLETGRGIAPQVSGSVAREDERQGTRGDG